jgi:3-deoxy-D-manno-octulosonate 8-phosphate phosphatase (KDO 8-P phosphatase)
MQECKMKQAIKLLICDVDGVMTDGKFSILPDGNEIKFFNAQDGIGLKQILNNNIDIAIISGRDSKAVQQRFSKLGVEHIYQGVDDKMPVFNELLAKLNITENTVAYIGDDTPDLAIMQKVAYPIAVANAVAAVKDIAIKTTTRCGGDGAVREACEWLLSDE